MNESFLEQEKKAQLDLFRKNVSSEKLAVIKKVRPSHQIISHKRHTPLEAPEYYGSKLDDHFYGFIKNLFSIHSQKAYKNDLSQFLNFIKSYYKGELSLEEVQKTHILLFLNAKLQNLSKRSFNRKLTVISKYFDYLIELKIIDDNPCQSIKRRPVAKSVETQALNESEIKDLFNKVYESKNCMHIAVIVLMFTTGMRVGEVCSLNIESLIEGDQGFYLKYTAKGSKEMLKKLPPQSINALLVYLKTLRMDDLENIKSPLFLGFSKKRLTPQGITFILQKYTGQFDKKVTPHTARASLATILLSKNWSSHLVSEFMGWDSETMVRMYDKSLNKRKLSVDKEVEGLFA